MYILLLLFVSFSWHSIAYLAQQHQRIGMRAPGVPNVAGRVVSVGHMVGPRMPLAHPPPPYPGPPPPYPGPIQVRHLLSSVFRLEFGGLLYTFGNVLIT